MNRNQNRDLFMKKLMFQAQVVVEKTQVAVRVVVDVDVENPDFEYISGKRVI